VGDARLGDSFSNEPSSADEGLGVTSPLWDDFDVLSLVSDLNHIPEPGSLLEFFREKRDALLGGVLVPNSP